MPDNYDKSVKILLVEDNPGDVELTRLAFEEAKLDNELHVVQDGIEALAFLNKEGEYRDAPSPGLILLDLNMPRMDGRELLAKLKQDQDLKRIPVIVLTTSREADDIMRSYDAHANSYIPKPVEMNSFIDVVRQLDQYWLSIVRLPPE